jgi:hypothetical protein
MTMAASKKEHRRELALKVSNAQQHCFRP